MTHAMAYKITRDKNRVIFFCQFDYILFQIYITIVNKDNSVFVLLFTKGILFLE